MCFKNKKLSFHLKKKKNYTILNMYYKEKEEKKIENIELYS
jgi:hypothetical protein